MERKVIDLSRYFSLFLWLSTYLPTYLSSMYLYFYRSIDLSTYLSTYLSIYRSIYLPIFLTIYLSNYLSVDLSIYLSISLFHLSICLAVYLSVYLSIYLSTCLSVVQCHSVYCSEHVVFCTFWLRNVRRATTTCTFSTSEPPKVARTCGALYILTSKCASRLNGMHFFNIRTSKNGANMWCFVHFDLEMCFAPQRRALFRHLNL